MQKKYFMTGLLFVTPITLILLTFLIFPIAQSFYYSLTNWKGIGTYSFIGFKNYADIFKEDVFVHSLWRTLAIGLSAAVLSNVLGLFFAVLLDQPLRTKKVLRALCYIPNVIPIVVAAFVWRYILDANSGMANQWLSALAGRPVTIAWVDSPDYVVPTIVLITVWQMMGPIIIIYLAALQGVPGELLEAGMLDGASRPRRFVSIVLPMIAPGITVNVLIGLANGIRLFDLPFALTGGGPANASETLAIRIYRYAFQSSDMAYGMAASFVMTLVVLAVTCFFVALSRKYEQGAHGA
ncbi:raffinose/stachyose/melibiose transport system permease protein [Paenibacillus tianmuensis]|uniref:Raffinose/stachyose/melibiose transport system permease protein n=1 Tax=Paenibacillus tianmuensis TaxID=624147 RepID=A0A1G4T6Z1_9BACL|nr:sugar ABC transporter permease [Paenibacillus tianmuensis]SCW77232.1 raffinose/stachyose/melibiose transport system permease protein [Paenibacillus tianmuensis]